MFRSFLSSWLRLDHALLSSELRCLSIREGEGEGSDHRPLIVELAVPAVP